MLVVAETDSLQQTDPEASLHQTQDSPSPGDFLHPLEAEPCRSELSIEAAYSQAIIGYRFGIPNQEIIAGDPFEDDPHERDDPRRSVDRQPPPQAVWSRKSSWRLPQKRASLCSCSPWKPAQENSQSKRRTWPSSNPPTRVSSQTPSTRSPSSRSAPSLAVSKKRKTQACRPMAVRLLRAQGRAGLGDWEESLDHLINSHLEALAGPALLELEEASVLPFLETQELASSTGERHIAGGDARSR